MKGIFVISLDFELHYGVSDTREIKDYHKNLLGTPEVVEQLLNLFRRYEIHSTWATVGLLFAQHKEEIGRYLPTELPTYEKRELSNYHLLPSIGQDIQEDPYHYAWPLIEVILKEPGQEIATHTFSHYYCLEQGQTLAQFEMDLKSAIEMARNKGVEIKSIVFPRNQYNEEHLDICHKQGIICFRGNESHWLYLPRKRSDETQFRRAGRFLDSYISISGDHHKIENNVGDFSPINIPANRFLRPYNSRLAKLDFLRLARITNEMTVAAEQEGLYHLWWHPHNFGSHPQENIRFLSQVLDHFARLRKSHGMISMNMQEAAITLANG